MDNKQTKQGNNDWHRLDFSVPITSAATNGDFTINGVAINSTLTRNGVEFTGEELQKSAKSLKNKPLLKDHVNSIDAIVGRVTDASFDSTSENVKFSARVMDSKMKQMISEGLITSVSVGAMVQDLEEIESSNGFHLRAKGIDFVELSLVAVPADPNAGLAQAVKASYELKQSLNPKKEETKVTESKTETESKSETKVEFQVPKELTEALSTIAESNKKINERLDKLEKSSVDEEEKKTSLEDENKVEEKVDKTVGQVTNSNTEEKMDSNLDNYELKQSDGKGLSFSMKSYEGTSFSKLQHRASSAFGGNE